MNWFEQNRFLGWFLIGLALGCLGVGYFFFRAKISSDAASARLKTTAAEVKRLESLTPFPDESHYQEANAQAAIIWMTPHVILAWVSITPFGAPVVPDV
jgi:hypothetical protein